MQYWTIELYNQKLDDYEWHTVTAEDRSQAIRQARLDFNRGWQVIDAYLTNVDSYEEAVA